MSPENNPPYHLENRGKPPSSVWLWGAFLGLAMAMLAATVGEWLYNSKRHENSAADRAQIRAQQQRIVEVLERIEKKAGRQ